MWIEKVTPGSNSKLKKAITYIQNRRDILMTYLEDSSCSLSNNLSENVNRPVTVGRKNWLFSDTPDIEVAKLTPWNEVVQELCKNKIE